MVIGKKSGAVGFMYVTVGILFILIMVFVLSSDVETEDRIVGGIFGSLFVLVDLFMVIGFFLTPKNAIILNADKSITLPGDNVTISMAEVTDISYKRASARGIQYKWGKVYISTAEKKYFVNYISSCEKVAKQLTSEMYAYRTLAGLQ